MLAVNILSIGVFVYDACDSQVARVFTLNTSSAAVYVHECMFPMMQACLFWSSGCVCIPANTSSPHAGFIMDFHRLIPKPRLVQCFGTLLQTLRTIWDWLDDVTNEMPRWTRRYHLAAATNDIMVITMNLSLCRMCFLM